MRELPLEQEEAFSTGAWVVTVLLLIAFFGLILLIALAPGF